MNDPSMPDDLARTAAPGELWSDEPFEDELDREPINDSE